MITVTALRLGEIRFKEYEIFISSTRYGVNLHPIWFATYTEAFDFDSKELILEARDPSSGELCGFLPLLRRDDRPTRFFKQRRLLSLGYRPTDFFDIPSLPDMQIEVTLAMAEWLKANSSLWDQMMLNLIPSDSPNWRPFVESLKKEGFNPTVAQDRAYLKLDATASYDEYLQTLGTKKRKEIRYYKNRLAKAGTLAFEHIGNGCQQYFDDFVDIYADRRGSLNQSNPFTRSYMPQYEFMKKIVERYAERGWMRLSLLKLDGNIIAYTYHFIYNQVDYYSMPAFLDEYKGCSPGKVLLMELIRNAFEDPDIHEFNFMRYEAPYKLWFNPTREKYVSITVDNPWSWRNKVLPVVQYLSKFRHGVQA